jgi:hypothetical protein
MCTVSFFPVNNRVFITSNRDEKITRLPAEPPLLHKMLGATLLFPKDRNKGGTWICVNGQGDCGVLLNGAKNTHVAQLSYRHSRGLILPQLLSAIDPVESFGKWDADNIEPFTLVLYVRKRLYECRWDGTMKSINRLPVNRPHLWSSATLYDSSMQEQRKAWFDRWLRENPAPGADDIIGLHRDGGDGDSSVDFKMNRSNELLTVSITSVQLEAHQAVMKYHAVAEGKLYRNSLSFSQATSTYLKNWCQKFVVRLLHWEYWPFHLVYAPIYPYWFWLCLKARSLFFFTASNPTIRNGGFLMESKKEIYDLMPVGSYPKTVLVEKAKTPAGHLNELVCQHGLFFPLIAKPDIGLRGIAVKLVQTEEDLTAYHHQSTVDYLLQAYVPSQNEVGIFYCRIPGSKEGQITGVAGKELLTVAGDGVQTISELVAKENRSMLQAASLRQTDPVLLTQVLCDGETKLLVPYGNHSRGAKFVDLSNDVNDELRGTINSLCLQIPGFYFGRLDIRYNNWEELCAGRNFSVIELNGAGSEPAHIYDPRHSIFFGWKEIMRHLNLLYCISRQNKQMKKVSYLSLKEGVNLFRENAAYMRRIS